jgi:hypothetical protein
MDKTKKEKEDETVRVLLGNVDKELKKRLKKGKVVIILPSVKKDEEGREYIVD